MALTKDKVCVYIENEAQLNEAKELLEKYGEKIAEDGAFELKSKLDNYLQFFLYDLKWRLLSKWGNQITLSKLEEILKND